MTEPTFSQIEPSAQLSNRDGANFTKLVDQVCEPKHQACNTEKSTPLLNDNPVCIRRTDALNRAVSDGISLEQAISELAKTGPSLIFLGENHGTETSREMPSLLKTLKQKIPELTCLFIESSDAGKKTLNALADGQFDAVDNGIILERMDTYKMARQLEVKIIPVDQLGDTGMICPGFPDPKGPMPPWVMTNEGLNARDKKMSEEILAHITGLKPNCGRSVMIVGKSHLSDLDDPSRKSLATLLREAGQNIVTVNVQPTGPDISGHPDPLWHWDICGQNPRAPGEIRVFAGKRIPPDVLMAPVGGTWQTYDLTVVYPDKPYYSIVPPPAATASGQAAISCLKKHGIDLPPPPKPPAL